MDGLPFGKRPWRRGLLLCLAVAAAAAMSGVGYRAEATHTMVRVQGDRDHNAFRISVTTASSSIEICTSATFCFTKARSTLDAILVEGFEGDDTLTIDHGSDVVTDSAGNLPITFVGGTGADRVVVCDTACEPLATEYGPGSTSEEMRLVQRLGSRQMELTVQDVLEVQDRAPGSTTVFGTAADDVITYSASPGAGRVSVDVLTPYVLAGKHSLTVDTGFGADRVTVEGAGGIAASPSSCPGGFSPVCVRSDGAENDRLVLAAVEGVTESVRLEPRAAGTGRLTGFSRAPDVDLAGVDALGLTLQDGEDSLALRTGVHDDLVEMSPGAPLRLRGEIDQDQPAPYALPLVEITGPGLPGAALRLEAGEGTDRFVHLPAAGDDIADLRPAGSLGSACAVATAECLAVSTDGQPSYQLAAEGVEVYDLSGGDGGDLLALAGDVAARTTWRGGAGTDRVRFDGTGSRATVDLGASTVTQAPTVQQPTPGAVTAGSNELVEVHAAGSSVHVLGTAADDRFTVVPTAAKEATVTVAGDPRSVLVRNGAVLSLDPGSGADDRVEVLGTAGNDTVSIGRATDLAVTVGSLLPVRIGPGAEAATLSTREGSDEVFVSGSGGPASLTVDGGSDTAGDRLGIAQPLLDATVTLDAEVGSGQVGAAGPAVAFAGIETVDVEGDGGASRLTLAGSDAGDTLVQQGNAVTGSRTTVRFSRFPELILAAGVGDDATRVAPATTSGVATMTVDGGTSTAAGDQLTVVGTTLGDALLYRPSGTSSGRVEVGGAPPVVFTSTESLLLDGTTAPPGGDRLVVDTPTLDGTIVLTPGATFDSGTIGFLDAVGVATGMPPLTFGSLGAGVIELPGTGQADRLFHRGGFGRDTFDVSVETLAAGAAGVVRLNSRIPVRTTGVHTLRLEGGDDADTFRVPSSHPYVGAEGSPAIQIDGGGPDASDTLRIRGGGGALTADLETRSLNETGSAAIGHSGVADVHLEAAGGGVTVLGKPGPDALLYTPTGSTAGRVASGAEPVILFSGVGRPVLVDPRDGADGVSVEARTASDDITVVRAPVTEITVAGLLGVQVPTTAESLDVRGGDGEDVTTVTGAGGPAALTLDGGLPVGTGDRLVLVDPTVAVNFATDPSSGRLESLGGPVTFAATEVLAVTGDGTGTLTVRGTDGADSLTIGTAAVPTVEVNAGADVVYGGFPDVVLEGRGGQDLTSVSFAELGDVRTVRALGGDPSLGDQVVAQDRFGASTTFTATPTGPGEALLTLDRPAAVLAVETTESLVLDGRLGDDRLRLVTPRGAQDVRVDPDDTLTDAGSMRVGSLLPVAFQQLGAATATVIDAEGLRSDRVIVDGSAASNRFTVAGDQGEIRLEGWLPVIPASALDVTLQGFDGDDAFNVIGALPYRTAVLDGGSPDDGDSLSAEGAGGPVTVDLNARSLSGYGGTILFPGVSRLHTDAAGSTLTELGTDRDDAICYDPQAPRDGRLFIVGAPGGGDASSVCLPDLRGTNVLHTFVDVARFVVDPRAGADEVIVNGTTDRDVVTVHGTFPESEVTVHPSPESGGTFRLPVAIAVATAESVVIASDSGSDSIDVTAYNNNAPRFTVYGESPSTKLVGDEMVLRDGSGRAHLSNTTSRTAGDGTAAASYRSTGIEVRVDYHGVEKVTLLRDPKTD